jgi:hypothetical protein
MFAGLTCAKDAKIIHERVEPCSVSRSAAVESARESDDDSRCPRRKFSMSPFASAKHDVHQIDYTAYVLKRRQEESVQSETDPDGSCGEPKTG